jgi:hypothetical protein
MEPSSMGYGIAKWSGGRMKDGERGEVSIWLRRGRKREGEREKEKER